MIICASLLGWAECHCLCSDIPSPIQGDSARGKKSYQEQGTDISWVPVLYQSPHGHFAQITSDLENIPSGCPNPHFTHEETEAQGKEGAWPKETASKGFGQSWNSCSGLSNSETHVLYLPLLAFPHFPGIPKIPHPNILLCSLALLLPAASQEGSWLPMTCWAGLSLVMVSSHLDLVLFFSFLSGLLSIKS